MTPATGVGTTAVVLATARYYRYGPGLPPLALVLAEYYRLGSTAPCPPLRNTEWHVGNATWTNYVAPHRPCTVTRLYNVLHLCPSSALCSCVIYDYIISVLNCSRPSSSRLPTWDCLSRHSDGELRAPAR